MSNDLTDGLQREAVVPLVREGAAFKRRRSSSRAWIWHELSPHVMCTSGSSRRSSSGLLMQMHYVSVFTNPKISGLALWQFADIPIDRLVSDDEHRPRGLNNKGQRMSWMRLLC